MDLARRRAATETRIAALQQARGVALLDGKSFDARELTALETELDAIEAAEGEAARRVRAAVEAAGQARAAALKEKLQRRNTDRLDAVDRAEQAARDLCEAAKLWIAANEDCGDLVRSLKQSGGAGILNASETESRLGFMLACALKPLFGMRRKLGMVTFPDALPRFAGNWREAEQTITQQEILLAGNPPGPERSRQMTKAPLELICDGKAALEFTAGSMEPGPRGLPIMWLCRPNGERLELIRGREKAEARAAALIAKGAL